MDLRLHRKPSAAGCTIGLLDINGVFECFTLEDEVRSGPKVPGSTAIPAGRYRVEMLFSPRFGHQVPHILDVPGFTAIEIHAGNRAIDTRGCVLVGQSAAHDSIASSALALGALQPKIAGARARHEDVWITIEPTGAPTPLNA